MISKIFFSVCALSVVLNASMASPSNIDQQFTKASNDFATNLYQKVASEKPGNVIISPVSIQSALSLVMFGSSGETKQQLLSGLKYPSAYNTESIASSFKNFNDNVKQTNGLKIATKIYVQKNYSVKDSFKAVATKSFNSEAQTLNFAQSEQSANEINEWVEDRTNNKIRDLIKADSLDSDTRMVLVNAIYFKGFWTYQFDPKQTFKAPFFLDETNSVDTDFMKIKKHFNYGEIPELDATALELPYKDSDITMLIILPKQRTGLKALEEKLTTVDLNEVTKNMYSQEVNVEIPKFKIEFEVDLVDTLSDMGMDKMFSDSAEFNELLETDEKLKVSKVIHKAFIEVNEEGAEAAAATGVIIKTKMARRLWVFKADHPFIFAFRKSRTLLFLGRNVQ